MATGDREMTDSLRTFPEKSTFVNFMQDRSFKSFLTIVLQHKINLHFFKDISRTKVNAQLIEECFHSKFIALQSSSLTM